MSGRPVPRCTLEVPGEAPVALEGRTAAMAVLLAAHQQAVNDPRAPMGKAVLSFTGGRIVLTLELSLGMERLELVA